MSSYQRSFSSREDPRLRHRSPSPKESRKSPSRTSKSTASWDNRNQFTPTLQTSYQHLQPSNVYSISPYGNTTYYGYESYNYNQYQYNATTQAPYIQGGAVVPTATEEYPQASWSAAYPSQNTSSEYTQSETSAAVSTKKSEGVAEELSKQKEGLLKEREIYEDRVAALKEKLKLLVDQKDHLSSKRSPDRETLHIIKENTKLQLEIQSKITDANNVIEILTNLIGDKKKEKSKESSKSSSLDETKVERINYKHYDPEIHWCRMCDVFPQSAKELLQHLHSKQHQKISQEENPWHKLPPEPKYEEFEGAPSRRLPIKGLQFFVASTAWYCRLCDSWIGDLHCASQHLMSVTHSQNYANFVEQNPHWEVEWLKDRDKALERVKRSKSDSDTDEKKKKNKKDKHSPQTQLTKDKKKKKTKKRKRQSSDSSSSSSSSSSSDDDREDKSKSIRVFMRNKIKMLTEGEEKWGLLNKIVLERKRKELKLKDKELPPPPSLQEEDKLMSQWMTVSAPPDKDKQMLEGLKEKLKQKNDAEKAKAAAEAASKKMKENEEYERKIKEKERQALLEREEDLRRKEQERLSVKMKGEVKIRGKDNYRKRRSHSRSRSPEHHRKRSRSRSSDRRPNRNGRSDESPKRHDDKKSFSNKRLPFIGRMPLFKNQKGSKKPDDERKTKEIQKEDYDIPRKTRFQPGNLAKAFIPKPDVVCFPKLSSYPPLAPPPPAILEPPPEPPKISSPKAPPAPIIEETQDESSEEEPEDPGKKSAVNNQNNGEPDYNMMYDESMYYGNMDFNMMYQPPPENFAFMQVPNSNDAPVPPLQPPPLPPDDPNEDLALLGLSSDDMAVQHL